MAYEFSRLEGRRSAIRRRKIETDVRTPQGVQQVSAEKLLVSVGRVPNLELDFQKVALRFRLQGFGPTTGWRRLHSDLCGRRCGRRASSGTRRIRARSRSFGKCHGDGSRMQETRSPPVSLLVRRSLPSVLRRKRPD